MEFCQTTDVGTLGYCGNDLFLISWNFYVDIDPKVIGGHIKNIQKIYLEFFWKTWKYHGILSVWKCENPVCKESWMMLLPPAYVLRREGNVSVCPPQGGGGTPVRS